MFASSWPESCWVVPAFLNLTSTPQSLHYDIGLLRSLPHDQLARCPITAFGDSNKYHYSYSMLTNRNERIGLKITQDLHTAHWFWRGLESWAPRTISHSSSRTSGLLVQYPKGTKCQPFGLYREYSTPQQLHVSSDPVTPGPPDTFCWLWALQRGLDGSGTQIC